MTLLRLPTGHLLHVEENPPRRYTRTPLRAANMVVTQLRRAHEFDALAGRSLDRARALVLRSAEHHGVTCRECSKLVHELADAVRYEDTGSHRIHDLLETARKMAHHFPHRKRR